MYALSLSRLYAHIIQRHAHAHTFGPTANQGHQQAAHILVACHVLSSQRRLWGRKPDATWGAFLETLRRGRKNPVTPKLWVETSRWCAAHETKETWQV